jgi:hypothetical protein
MVRRKTDGSLLGRWTIVEMEVWDRDAFELLGEAFLEFGADAMGEFRFIAVEGQMNCRYGSRDGKPLVEFTWDGNDECDPATGSGWAVVDGEALCGRIFIHLGDASNFRAVRGRPRAAKSRRPSL